MDSNSPRWQCIRVNSCNSCFNFVPDRGHYGIKVGFLYPLGCNMRRCDASVFSTSRTVLLAAHVVNHKLSEASATINSQLQAKRICARARSAEKLGTINCDVVALAHFRAPSASGCAARRATASSEPRTLNLEQLTFNFQRATARERSDRTRNCSEYHERNGSLKT